MSESKHTPGPWVPGRTGQEQIMLLGNGGEGDYVCHIQITQIGGGAIASLMEGPRRANARLIAASPDLLTSLRSLIEAYDAHQLEINSPDIDPGPDTLNDPHPPYPWHEEWLHHARAAIAKATGAQS